MNVYSELLEILLREPEGTTGGLFGTLTAVSPLTVTVRGTALTEGLFYPSGTRFREEGTVFQSESIGREVALLPCEEGFWILGFVGGGTT